MIFVWILGWASDRCHCWWMTVGQWVCFEQFWMIQKLQTTSNDSAFCSLRHSWQHEPRFMVDAPGMFLVERERKQCFQTLKFKAREKKSVSLLHLFAFSFSYSRWLLRSRAITILISVLFEWQNQFGEFKKRLPLKLKLWNSKFEFRRWRLF